MIELTMYERLKKEYRQLYPKIKSKGGCYKKCQVCGSRENVELHHIIPLSQGGTNEINNIIPLCRKCHVKAHSNTPINREYKPKGRKRREKPFNYSEIVEEYLHTTNITLNECCEILGVGKSVFYRWLEEDYPNRTRKHKIPYRRKDSNSLKVAKTND